MTSKASTPGTGTSARGPFDFGRNWRLALALVETRLRNAGRIRAADLLSIALTGSGDAASIDAQPARQAADKPAFDLFIDADLDILEALGGPDIGAARTAIKAMVEETCQQFLNCRLLVEVHIAPFLKERSFANQATIWNADAKPVMWDHLKFQSRSERIMHLALCERGLTFSPLPAVIHSAGQQVEPGFLLFHAGRVAVIELDGSNHDSKTSEQEKRRLAPLTDQGLLVYRIVHRHRLEYAQAARLVEEVLSLMENDPPEPQVEMAVDSFGPIARDITSSASRVMQGEMAPGWPEALPKPTPSASADGDPVSFIKDIHLRYRQASGLHERRFFDIEHSLIIPSDVMVLGAYPNGNPKEWSPDHMASMAHYENGEHEYVDGNLPLKGVMQHFLRTTLGIDDDEVRRIPKTHLVFRRATTDTMFGACQGISLTAAVREALPFVEEMIARVSPRVIVLEGRRSLDIFRPLYCPEGFAKPTEEPIKALLTGKGSAKPTEEQRALANERGFIAFRPYEMTVTCLGRPVMVIGLGHPVYFGRLPEWQSVLEAAQRVMRGALDNIER